MIELTATQVVERDGVLAIAPSDEPVLLGAKSSRSCTADGERAKAADEESRRQVPARTLPRSLALTYYDAARDYQTGQARAVICGGGRSEWRTDSPIVLSATAAKEIANSAMARRWADRDRFMLRLDPSFVELVPGAQVELADVAGLWLIDSVTIEQMVVTAEIRRQPSGGIALPADGGRPVSEVDHPIGPTDLALFDAPDLGFGDAASVEVTLAASSAGAFRAVPVATSVNGMPFASFSAARRAVLGRTASVLGSAPAELIDMSNMLDVALTASDQLLLNADDSALAMGANAMLVGGELIQFGCAAEFAPGRFRLSRLLRGRRGTEWAIGSHMADERVVLIDRATLVGVTLGSGALGATVSASAHGVADDPLAPPSATVVAQGESLRPLAPARVTATRLADGAIRLDWLPRSVAGLGWTDGAGDPSLADRRFLATVETTGGQWAGEATGVATLTIDSGSAAPLGHGAASISLSEIAVAASSRPAPVSVII